MNSENLTGFELMSENEELVMLTKMFASMVAKKDKQFNDFLNFKTESDFICIGFDSDKFLEIIFKNPDYYEKLTEVLLNVLWFMKKINNHPEVSTFIKIKSYEIRNRYMYIKFNTSDDKTIRYVKLDLYDIMWGILMFKNKALYQILYDEIIAAPFIQ